MYEAKPYILSWLPVSPSLLFVQTAETKMWLSRPQHGRHGVAWDIAVATTEDLFIWPSRTNNKQCRSSELSSGQAGHVCVEYAISPCGHSTTNQEYMALSHPAEQTNTLTHIAAHITQLSSVC